MKVFDDKIFCVSKSNLGYGITSINDDGTVDKTALFSGEITKLICLCNDRLAVVGYSNGKHVISELNTGTFTYKDLYLLSDDTNEVYDGCSGYEFIYTSKSALFGYDSTMQNDEKLFSFASINVNSNRLSSIIKTTEDGTVYFTTSEYKNKQYIETLVKLVRADYNAETDRQVVTLYSSNVTFYLEEVVANFNRNNNEIRVEIVDSDYNADIIDISDHGYYKKLVSMGVLEDLYPYIDSDKDISRGDFFSNILVAAEQDGRLYQSMACFSIDTVLGASSVVGDVPGWNYDKFYSSLSSMPDGCEAFDFYVTRDDVFRAVLAIDLDWYIDWENAYCNFDNENFVAMLEFVNTFPASFNSTNHVWDDLRDNSDMRIQNNMQMLLRTSLYTFDDACRCGFEYDEDVTYIGYPTLNGTGNSVIISTLENGENFAISANSTHKEQAWSFIRTFFMEEYQNGLTCFPVNVNAFNRKLEDYKLEYLLDDDGDVMYDKKTGEPLHRALGSMFLSNYKEVYYYGLNEREADKFVSLVTSVNKVADNNSEMYTIINSICKDYFNGSISSDEAAKNVQTKVMEYLNVSVNQK